MNGLEDKQALRALDLQRDRNSGSPTSHEAHGDGASIVLGGVTPSQGAWESQVQGKGKQVLRQINQAAMRDASVFNHMRTGKAVKNWRAVCGESCTHGSGRGGEKRAVFIIPPEREILIRQVRRNSSTSLAALYIKLSLGPL